MMRNGIQEELSEGGQAEIQDSRNLALNSFQEVIEQRFTGTVESKND